MSKKTYNFQVTAVPARPRSKRRQLFGGTASASGGTSSRPGGGSIPNTGNGVSHTHDNKVALDAISIDSENYLFLTQKPSGQSDSQRRKVKAGHSDTATRATDADNADKWDGRLADDYIDQPVRTTDDVTHKIVTATEKIVTPEASSPDFQSGIVRAGYKISTDPHTKRSTLEIGKIIADELLVDLLTHQRVQSIGGVLIVSQAWADIVRVENLGSAYRCFYIPDDGAQLWRAGDQALCKNAGKYYWRYVSSISDQPNVEGEHWLNLSVATADGSGVPADGDEIVLLGHRGVDTTRQGATIISSGTLGYADPFVHYGGINSFSLAGKQLTVIGDNSRFVGSSFTIVAPDGSLSRIPRDCGAWSIGRSEYYDRKSYKGSMWLCVASDGTTVEPSDTAEGVWLKQVERGDQGSKGDRFKQVYMWTGAAGVPKRPVGRTLAEVAAEGWVESNTRARTIFNKATNPPLALTMADGSVRLAAAGLPKHYRLFVATGELTAEGGALVGEWSEPLLSVEQSVIDGLNSDITATDKKADDAKAEIDSANAKIADMADDNKLTPNEKQQTAIEWARIQKDHASNLATATALALSTSNYVIAYNTLSQLLSTLLANLTTTSPINGEQFRTTFSDWYTQNATITVAISKGYSDEAKAEIDEANAKIDAATKVTEMVKKNITEVEGGMVLTQMLQTRNNDGVVTAGISGVNDYQGQTKLPAIWAGGTYIEAVSGTAPIIFRHNGQGKVGMCEINERGSLKMLAKDGSKQYSLLITNEKIIDVSSGDDSRTTNNSSFSDTASQTTLMKIKRLPNSIAVTKGPVDLKIVATLSCESQGALQTSIRPVVNANAHASLYLCTTGSRVKVGSVGTMFSYKHLSDTLTIDTSIEVVNGKTYWLELEYGGFVEINDDGYWQASVSASTMSWSYVDENEDSNIQICSNGIGVSRSSAQQFQSKIDPITGNCITTMAGENKLSGKTTIAGIHDAPGVLCSGTVSGAGAMPKGSYYRSSGDNCNCRKISQGLYEITHNIGHSNYFVTANLSNNASVVGIAIIHQKNKNTVQILTANMSSSRADLNFDFIICGSNTEPVI